MPHPTAVINVVGLSPSLLGDASPALRHFGDGGALRRLAPVLPAVTCSVQSSMLTGKPVRDHGIVGNGWFDRDLGEVQFWKQSNRLVQAEKVWETARRRDDTVTCANLFWWYNMYSSAECSVTPRPIYTADGRKIPDVYTEPPGLRDTLQERLGRFPLFNFWGPASSIASSQWIAEAAMEVYERHHPTLTLVYLPHLDYALQKLGPDHADIPTAVREIDAVVGSLLAFFDERGVRSMIVSEYGIEAADRPVALNRVLREAGWLRVRQEQGLELLDPGASDAFAVADHQIAHVYVRDPARRAECRDGLAAIEGVAAILDDDGKRERGVDHRRAGDLLVVAESGAWFTYDYWRDDRRAPDFARTVDIHRKPGYDPRELFLDPAMRWPRLRLASKLLRKKLGFRQLMDVVPLDAGLVRGTHGRDDMPVDLQPVLMTRGPVPAGTGDRLPCTAVRDVIQSHLFAE